MNSIPKHVGVVVGRFQVPKLHKGHRYLLQHVKERHDALLIVLGTPRSLPTPRDPLSFEVRRTMIAKAYPDATIVPLQDTRSNEVWSTKLDALIAEAFPEVAANNIFLYGSRASFFPAYSGRYQTIEVPPLGDINGTRKRECLKKALRSEGFRQGVIHSHVNRPSVTYPTVDIAILREDGSEILLGGKDADGEKMRFVGGFVDPKDPTLELAAKRESYEETSGIEIDDLRYVGSTKVDDWRYRGTGDGIMTTLFKATYIFGAPRASDDLVRLAWVPTSQLMDVLVPEHQPLGAMLLSNLSTQAA